MRILGLPNTASITNNYDVMARLLNTTLQNSAGTVLDAYTYGYDVGYERTNVIRTGGDYVNYAYDGIGQLTNATAKEPGGVTTLYLVDTQNPTGYPQVLEESTVASGVTNLSTTYTYGLALISQRSTATSFYGLDGHGNMRFLTGLTGSITDTYTYDAYGNLITSSGSTPNHYLYCAEQYDTDLRMYYLRSRYYQPATGRFWTMDTYEGDQEEPLSLHKYLYCFNNPINKNDPSGCWPSEYFWKVHQQAIQDTLSFLSAAELQTLESADAGMDASEYQTSDFSYIHAMSSPVNSVIDARIKANNFVRSEVSTAKRLEAKGKHNLALKHLGQAMHTLQDSTSPAHENFQFWDGSWGTFDYPFQRHILEELYNPGPGSELEAVS